MLLFGASKALKVRQWQPALFVAALENYALCHTQFLILTTYTDYLPQQLQLTGLYH